MTRAETVSKSGLWSLILQVARLGLNAVVFLILARWLTLAEIGVFAIAFTPVQILQNTVRGGFSETIIQDRSDPDQFAVTLFWCATVAGVLGSCLVLLFAVAMGPVFGMGEVGWYMAAMAPTPLLIGLSAVPEGVLRRSLRIKALAIRTTLALSIAACLALICGYLGFGTWALVGFTLVNAICATGLVFYFSGFRPKLHFDAALARQAIAPVGFISSRLVVGIAALPVLQFLIGVILGPAAAGAFQIAQRVMKLCEAVALEPVRFAILPLFAQIADDPPRLARGLVKTIGLVCFTMVPILFGLFAISPQLLPLLIGETNGPPSVPALQALLAIGGAGGVYSIIMQAFTATERSGIAFVWSLVNLGLRLVLGLLAMTISVTLVAASFAAASYIIIPLLLRQTAKHFGVNTAQAWAEIWRPTCIGVVMLAIVSALGWIAQAWPSVIVLALQVLVGAAIYIGLSAMFNRTQLSTMRSLVTNALSR